MPLVAEPGRGASSVLAFEVGVEAIAVSVWQCLTDH